MTSANVLCEYEYHPRHLCQNETRLYIGVDARISDCSTVGSPNRSYALHRPKVKVKVQWLAIVLQESTLFTGTLRFSLDTTHEDMDKDLAYSTHGTPTGLRRRESKEYHRRLLGNLHNRNLAVRENATLYAEGS